MLKGKIRVRVDPAPKRINLLPASALFTALTVICFAWFRNIIINNPVDYHISDVIPTVDILSKRLLSGQYVYDVITNFGHKLPPTYMPLQWFPFVISSALGFDHRWIAFAVWLISVFVLFIYHIRKNNNPAVLLVNTVLPFAVLLIFMQNYPSMFANTFELMLAGYYILFGLSLISKGYLKKTLGLTLTLLSRYATLLFAPFYMLILFLSKKKKEALLISLITILLIVFIYVLPFFIKQPSILRKGFSYYTVAAAGEWQPKEFQKPGDNPFHLFRGVGFACWFYEYFPGNLMQKLSALKKVHLLISLLSLFLVFVVFLKYKHKMDHPVFLLVGFKFYLTFFYSFIQVPYIYLHLVPVFISVLITGLFLQNKFFVNIDKQLSN